MISIIVPVYNTARYLSECINSILNQTFKDIEVILIDDGSTDNSLEICNGFAEMDKRVRVYHKGNSGVSESRNLGISYAKGELISFCDSDDVIDISLYQTLYEAMHKHDVDRVVSGYAFLYENGRKLYCKPRVDDGKYAARNILRKMIDDGTMSGFLFSGVNNSLFKKRIIDENRILFDSTIKYNEDSLFSFQYMYYSNSIYSLQSHATYFYRQHASSATKNRTVGDKYVNLRNALYNMNLDEETYCFNSQMMRRYVTEALWQILDVSEKVERKEALKCIRNLLEDKKVIEGIHIINISDLNKYKKLYYIMMKYKMSVMLYFVTKRIFPIVSRYLSR